MSPELVASLLEPLGFEASLMEEVPKDELARNNVMSNAKEYIARWRRVKKSE